MGLLGPAGRVPRRARKDRAATPLYNPVHLVRWNIHKTYLRDLEARGAQIIPTLWLDKADAASAAAAFDNWFLTTSSSSGRLAPARTVSIA
jgi:hypothetical protein